MRSPLRHLMLIGAMLLIVAGCGGKTIVKEDISERVAAGEQDDVTWGELSREGAGESVTTEVTEDASTDGAESAFGGETLAEEELGEELAGAGPADEGAEGAAGEEAGGTSPAWGTMDREGKEQERDTRTFASIMPSKELTERAVEEGRLYTIHFDFDRYTIRPEDRELLIKNAEWLRRNPGVKVWIEGHADERGSSEYNIALGEKRARSVKKFLVDLGISPDRLSTITYGEERPVDPRHNEQAWAKNRRAEFVISVQD